MFKRYCKKCGNDVFHKDEKNLKRAIKANKICLSCSNSLKSIGEKNSMFGKTHSEETKEKIKEKRKLQTFSNSTKEKMRIIAANRIIDNNWHPAFNISACNVIENYGKKYGYNFQHAMNGGEYYITKLGYWVDGYDIEKNVVMEYYEIGHKSYIEKDEIRIQTIKNYLNCDVIILREWVDLEIINELN